MLNIRLKNLFVVLFLFISLTLTYGCSIFSDKPSEETMKALIEQRIHGNNVISYNFEEFKITNDFRSKKNDENWYCIEVNYKLKEVVMGRDSAGKITQSEIMRIGKQEKYSFIKHEKQWYGIEGWK
jgi:hypothetical protein